MLTLVTEYAVWGMNRETGNSFLDSSFEERAEAEQALIDCRAASPHCGFWIETWTFADGDDDDDSFGDVTIDDGIEVV